MCTTSLRRRLDGPHHATRARVRDLLARPDFSPPQGMDTAEHRAWVLARAQDLATIGDVGPGLGFPAAYGGADDVGAGVAAFEQLAQGDLSLLVKVGVQFGLFGGAILNLGTERHHDAYLRDVLSLELPGCFAMTEADHGSDVQHLRTTATYDAATDELVVHTPDDGAHKEYIGNAALHGRMAVVFAQLCVGGEEHGVHAVLVPIRDRAGRARRGVRIEDSGEKVGLNGVDNGRLWFDAVRVPRANLLDRYGAITDDGTYASPIEDSGRRFFTMLGTLVQGRVSVGGAATSAAKVAQTIAVRHAEDRTQFERPDGTEARLLDYPAHQRKLLPGLARTYALTFAQQELLAEHSAFERGADSRALEAHAAGLKAVQTRHATDTIQACREACGGLGYLAVNRFAALKADTDVFTTFEGDNTVLLQLVAKDLLHAYAKRFGSLDVVGKVGFVAEQVVGDVASTFGLRARVEELLPGGGGDLRDAAFLRGLLAAREEHLVGSVARRLQGLISGGTDPYEAFLACQDHALRAAEAHVERRVADAFGRAVADARDEGAAEDAELLAKVELLHLLSVVERDRGWFVEHGRLTGGRSKDVPKAVLALCAELRAHATALVDAFGVPERCLGGEEEREDAERPVLRAA